MKVAKTYLGDGVYAHWNGYGLVLTTKNGVEPSNTIYLKPEVIANLLAYLERIKAENSKQP